MMRTMKKLISILVVVVFAVLASSGSAFASEEQEQTGKVINVVYDDSGSMVVTGGQIIPRWSQAKYAMEVFCAMMGESDVMHIYPMSMEGGLGLTLYGNDGGRVQPTYRDRTSCSSGVARRSSASMRFSVRMAATLAAYFSLGVP